MFIALPCENVAVDYRLIFFVNPEGLKEQSHSSYEEVQRCLNLLLQRNRIYRTDLKQNFLQPSWNYEPV